MSTLEFLASSHAGQPRIGLPLASVTAGFPSPADDFIEHSLDLNSYLVHNPAATFFARVSGSSMINAGIHDGDLLVIDRSIPWKKGSIAVCNLNGEFTVKFVARRNDRWLLEGANPDMPAIALGEEDELQVWGLVTYIIHKVGRPQHAAGIDKTRTAKKRNR